MGQREGMGGRGLLAGSAAFAAMGIAGVVRGQIVVYVDRTSPQDGNGASWDTAFRGLSNAFDSVLNANLNEPVEFRIAQGVYRPTEPREGFRLAPLSTNSSATITIKGGFAGRASSNPDARDFVATPTVLSGDVLGNDDGSTASRDDNSAAVLTLDQESTRWSRTLDGLTIRDGGSPMLNGGSGVIARAESAEAFLTVQDCTIEENESSGFGHGLRFEHLSFQPLTTSVHIVRSTFRNNRSFGESGGGLRVSSVRFALNATAIIDRCTFDGNSASGGGGFYVGGVREAIVSHTTIRGNTSAGGGAAFVSAPLTMSNCLVTGNTSDWLHQGGIISAGIADIHNSTLAGNHSSIESGLSFGQVTLTNCIVKRNSDSSGGSSFSASNRATLRNSSLDFQLSPTGQFPTGGTLNPDSIGIFSFDPKFIDPDGPDNNPATWADNNYRLSPRSPAVDAGILDTSLSIVDLDGNDRYVSGMIERPSMLDLGCYESQITLCPSDIDGDGGVTIDDLLDFLVAFEAGLPLADLTTNGTTPFPDGGVTVDDLVYFLARFEQGC